jgi:hypothetical protein
MEVTNQMFALKTVVYGLTTAAMFFFAIWELQIRRKLTDGVLQSDEIPPNFGFSSDFSKEINRERILRSLSRERLFKYRSVKVLKFVFFALLFVEVLVLQP